MNDYMVHLLRLRERVDAEYDEQLSPHLREVLSAYADGLNFFAYWHTSKIIASDLLPVSPQGATALHSDKRTHTHTHCFIVADAVHRRGGVFREQDPVVHQARRGRAQARE
jgi:hypothetical protein